jgi:hypothetical protein
MTPREIRAPFAIALAWLTGPLADLLAWAGLYCAVPWLKRCFTGGSIENAYLVAGAYLLLCLGVALGRLLAPAVIPKDGTSGPGLSAWLSWPYAIFVIVMLLDAAGGFNTKPGQPSLLDRIASPDGWTVVLVSVLFLAITLAFPILAILPIKPRIPLTSPAHSLLKLVSNCAVNSMVLVTTAYWEWTLADAEPMGLSLGGRILVTLLIYPVFLLFYAPPRLTQLSLEPGRWALLPYLGLLFAVVWRFTA